MKIRKKLRLSGWPSLLVMCVLAGLCASIVYPVLFVTGQGFAARSRRAELLGKTDHGELLEACRIFLRDRPPGQYNVRYDRHPDVENAPKLLLDLKPTRMEVKPEGFLVVEMLGGMSHFGVRAYPEGFVAPNDHFWFGHRKLVEGLWYYDDGYDKYSEFAEEAEELIRGDTVD